MAINDDQLETENNDGNKCESLDWYNRMVLQKMSPNNKYFLF